MEQMVNADIIFIKIQSYTQSFIVAHIHFIITNSLKKNNIKWKYILFQGSLTSTVPGET